MMTVKRYDRYTGSSFKEEFTVKLQTWESKMKVSAIKRNTTAELIIEKILDLIKAGELKIGDQLPPTPKLVEKFGVGRSSVREAVRSLAVMGYLSILPGKGTFITKDASSVEITAHGFMKALESRPLFDIMEARLAVEQQCAFLAASRATDEQRIKIQTIIDKINSKTADFTSISKADIEAHLCLAESTNNDVMYELMKLLIDKVERYAEQFWATLPKNKAGGTSTITQALSHVIEGNGIEASESMREHLEFVTEKLRDVVFESI
jgi:GntR family transcriptional repressor for pyruvate dehydrogenase complex